MILPLKDVTLENLFFGDLNIHVLIVFTWRVYIYLLNIYIMEEGGTMGDGLCTFNHFKFSGNALLLINQDNRALYCF